MLEDERIHSDWEDHTMSQDVGKKLPEGFEWKAITPEDSPQTPMDMMNDPQLQKLSTPDLAVGDKAFGFARAIYDFSDGTRSETGNTFDLHQVAREKPVALIFGSYT